MSERQQGPYDSIARKWLALAERRQAHFIELVDSGRSRHYFTPEVLNAEMRKAALGSLDRVDTILKVLGMVNGVPDFTDQPKVINGCTDLFVEVFGDAGRHARSAVGNVMLPNQISVEIEGIVAVKP